MARKKSKGTKLKVFSGREETLNRVIFLILGSKKLLASYDLYREIRKIKGLRHVDSRTVYRRVQALEKEGWIVAKGSRVAKPGWDSALFELAVRGRAALLLDKRNIDEFLQTASEDQLLKLLDTIE